MSTWRKPVNKASSANQFRRNTQKTKAANVQHKGGTVSAGPMRGGWRL